MRPALLSLAIALVPTCATVRAGAPVSFHTDVAAVLSRAGCNSGPCHGNLNGKGGFKLSLRGFDPDADYVTLTRDMLARRTDPVRPTESLLLKKATGQVSHEGGVRFGPSGTEYAILRDWIAGGCRPDPVGTPRLVSLVVSPPSRVLIEPEDRVKLTATARYSDGSVRDVTGLVAFETNNIGVAKVLPTGEVIREQVGELVVLVRYLDLQVPVRLAFLPNRPVPDLASEPVHNEIDRLVYAQLGQLRLKPSALATDAVFLRRAYLDACGITPTAAEARRFLADIAPDKRVRLIDDLLARPEFASYWAQKWSDLLRNEEKSLDHKGVQVFHRWIKGWLAEDKPLTEFAREILAARGSTYVNPAANFYRAVRDPYQRAESVAQVFLGLRVSCAKCHNHPFDRWTQDDYHRFVALFGRIDYRVLENGRRDKFDKHEFVGEQLVLATHDGELAHPRGGDAVPKFLGTTTGSLTGNADRLRALADWVAAPENPFFAKAQANRVWFHLTGRGLVDPNDDFRVSNPPANPALLDHLAAEFARGGYRLKPLVRYIMTSRVYQLASTPNETNATDETHFSRALIQPLEAEQLLDAVSQTLGTPVKFPGYPDGTRAGEVPAPPPAARRGKEAMGPRFLKVFGKPDRLLTCECERSEDGGMMQALQLLTGELVHGLIRAPDNRLSVLLASGKSNSDVLDDLYLSALARYPSEVERVKLLAYTGHAVDRRAAWEDVAWGLVNAKEFLLRR
ncbi:DUF1549 and DUF1553 domain-containing protein [Fimbriiglobus ruber]|uniref:Translation initiation factor 2 n=1 Tax=Fimbriiglobus ruber TaxID=1908690 RepID=A0A225E154_9BACT|nr:DUF1549 and DUF1553 domain-containing protein [Fimbriiglobus ruber]OWK43219.1 Translation initiation factor 2 [Fimbriiglobus ruber]